MNPKSKSATLLLLGLLAGMFLMYVFSNYKIEKKTSQEPYLTTKNASESRSESTNYKNTRSENGNSSEISRLTEENTVIAYVKQNHQLPDFYITKNEAREQGWNPAQGNLCQVLPGRAIGGDKFSNREKQLPKGEQYYEADVNYNCGNRNADRIVYTENGEVWLTKNHYKTFEKQ